MLGLVSAALNLIITPITLITPEAHCPPLATASCKSSALMHSADIASSVLKDQARLFTQMCDAQAAFHRHHYLRHNTSPSHFTTAVLSFPKPAIMQLVVWSLAHASQRNSSEKLPRKQEHPMEI